MKPNILTIALLVVATTLNAQTIIGNYRPGAATDGITYCLPRTAVRIVLTAEKTTYTPGELQRYNDRYMHFADIKSEASERWELKNVMMETYGVADTTKYYTIALRPKTIAPFVSLTPDGRLLAIRDEASDIELSALPAEKAAAKPSDPRRYYTQEMLSAGSRAKLAELVAQEVYDIRESRNALVRGEAENTPKDGEQLRLMLNSLEQQEAALASLFAGTTQTSTHVFVLNVIPDKSNEKTLIARFSSHYGLVDAEDLSGEPIYVTVRQTETLPEPVRDEAIERKKAKMTQGLYYNVPARAEVRIHNSKQTLAKAEYPMAQFGVVEILSDALFNKGATTRAIFSGVTGALLKLSEN